MMRTGRLPLPFLLSKTTEEPQKYPAPPDNWRIWQVSPQFVTYSSTRTLPFTTLTVTAPLTGVW